MDARKALFRAKLREQKQEKRIESPLVRYNEYDQPVCRVCNITLKSESLWVAHQASRKHHEAIQNLKATANRASINSTNSDSTKDSAGQGSSISHANSLYKSESKLQGSGGSGNLPVETMESSSVSATNKQIKRALPEGFFDKAVSETRPFSQTMKPDIKKVKGDIPDDFFDSKEINEVNSFDSLSQKSNKQNVSESKSFKGTIPEGFFDNKDADLRARGIEPVKVDISDAYKEFEKEIQEDLQDVDDRLEEEEIDAAEVREEYESLEQMQYRERVEMVKKRLVEVRAARLVKGQHPAFIGQESSEDSSSGSDEEENFTVDWRAKHL